PRSRAIAGSAAEPVQYSVTASVLVQLEHCVLVAFAATIATIIGRPVEDPVAPFDHSCKGLEAVLDSAPTAPEMVQHAVTAAISVELEYGAGGADRLIRLGDAPLCRAVKHPVASFHQANHKHSVALNAAEFV